MSPQATKKEGCKLDRVMQHSKGIFHPAESPGTAGHWLSPSHAPNKTGTESTRKEMSYVLQLVLFHRISAYIKLFCCDDMLLNCFWKMLACLVKTVVRGLFCSVYLKVYCPMEFGKMP